MVARYTAGRCSVAFSKTYCSASIVFPEPGKPEIRLIPLTGRPPPSTSSRRALPLRSRSIRLSSPPDQGALAEQILDGGHEHQWIERLLEECVRAGVNRLFGNVETGDRQDRRRRSGPQAAAEVDPGPARDE